MWLDLSFNQIGSVNESLVATFPNVTTLYLHANQITKLSHIKKLSGFTHLKSLTLYGNPVEENKHYKNYILYCFPELQQLDFCVITTSQRQKVCV
jgi:Leucine-rich repeat (LRR) protein